MESKIEKCRSHPEEEGIEKHKMQHWYFSYKYNDIIDTNEYYYEYINRCPICKKEEEEKKKKEDHKLIYCDIHNCDKIYYVWENLYRSGRTYYCEKCNDEKEFNRLNCKIHNIKKKLIIRECKKNNGTNYKQNIYECEFCKYEKIYCEFCKSEILICNKEKHEKTKTHLSAIKRKK